MKVGYVRVSTQEQNTLGQPMEASGLERVGAQWRKGELSAAKAAAQLGMSRATFCRSIKELDGRREGEHHG